MKKHHVKSPVLFIIFNRPDVTRQVFDRIRAAKPSRLYVAADGPRPDRESDAVLCRQAREVVTEIDWECNVRTLFSDANKGCRAAVSGAINWFFEQEEEGIILEDDCLPHPDFFYFCDTLLARYRHDERIHAVTGTNQQMGQKWGEASYYFSRRASVWGWASWRRFWQRYDVDLKRYSADAASAQLKKIFDDPFLAAAWTQIFHDVKANKVDTWDYQLSFTAFFENSLCATPNVNLISNIGFGADATHTFDTANEYANLPATGMDAIVHPEYFVPEKAADYRIMEREHDLVNKWRRHNKLKRRFVRWIKSLG